MTSSPRTEPSFDCSAAKRPDERAICNDDDLAQRDQLGGQILAFLARKPAAVDAGNDERRRFIDARRVCGSEIDCIRREQDALLVALVRIATAGSRPAEAPINPVVKPWSERSTRYLGAILAILLCAAFGWLTRSALRALWRTRQTKAIANPETRADSEQPPETESAPKKSFKPRAASPSADLGWLARMAASWRRYRTSASTNRAIREIRHEERRPTRFRQGKLFDAYGAFLSQCTICDRSEGGARVRVEVPLRPIDLVRFVDEVEKIIVEAKVAWQRGNELGLAFKTTAKPADLSAMRAASAPDAERIRPTSKRM